MTTMVYNCFILPSPPECKLRLSSTAYNFLKTVRLRMSKNQILEEPSTMEVESIVEPVAETYSDYHFNTTTYKVRKFYPGDIVMKKSIPKHWDWVPSFGTVLKPAVGSETSGLSTDFPVHWESANRVEIMKGFQVSLVDRLLLRNMKVGNEIGAVGAVSNVKVLSTVQIIGTNHVVERVTLDRLRPISSYVRGQEILYKNWIGVVTSIKRNIWFLLDGGMGFYVESNENDGFMRNDPYWGTGVACPGIRTKLSASAMKSAKWISGPMKFFSKWIPPLSYLYSMAQCTINKTEVTGIEVSWLQVIPGVPDAESTPKPETYLARDKLFDVTVVGTPSSETVGINSVRMMKLRPEDSLTTSGYWLEAFKKRYIDEDEAVETKRSSPSSIAPLKALVIRPLYNTGRRNINASQAAERVFEVPVKVLHRQSIVDVAWNDGSVQRVHSIKLPSIVPTKDDSEYPQGMVVARLYNESNLMESYGVVMESDEFAKRRARMVHVKWILNGVVESTQEESILDIRPHPTYSLYQRGTVLFPRYPNSVSYKSAVVSDLNIAAGKMVVVVTADNSQHEVFPHMVTPLPKRCFWNFFTRKWTVDEIIPPPYQMICEFHPSKKYAQVSEPAADILTTNNNNPDELLTLTSLWDEPGFELLGFAPETHRYHKSKSGSEGYRTSFIQSIEKELKAMREPNSIPEGIWVRSYENRLDLLSVLMLGPSGTPFEDGVFLFDLQLSSDFPSKPPMVHYVSYTYEISPMLAWDGNFCVSALDWKFSEEPASFIVNCLLQMQALLFCAEPFFCDNRWPADKGTARGKDLSRFYNEQTFMRVLDSSWNMIHNPHEPWTTMIKSHFSTVLPDKLTTIEKWNLSENVNSFAADNDAEELKQYGPEFLLVPVSEGLQVALKKRLEKFRKIVPMSSPTVSGRHSKAESITDATADSESVPVEDERQLEIIFETGNANNDIIIQMCEPPELADSTDLVKDSPKNGETSSTDSQKNVVKRKGRGKKSGSKRSHKKKSVKSPASSGLSDSEPEIQVEVAEIPVILEEVSEAN